MEEYTKTRAMRGSRRHGNAVLTGNRGPKTEARALKRAQRMSEGTPEKPGQRNHMVALARSVTMQNERDKAARKHGGSGVTRTLREKDWRLYRVYGRPWTMTDHQYRIWRKLHNRTDWVSS